MSIYQMIHMVLQGILFSLYKGVMHTNKQAFNMDEDNSIQVKVTKGGNFLN